MKYGQIWLVRSRISTQGFVTAKSTSDRTEFTQVFLVITKAMIEAFAEMRREIAAITALLFFCAVF